MSNVTRRIGLSLGADICWPICYEEILRKADLTLPIDGDKVRFEVERVMIEPFAFEPHASYDVVIDRLTHWFHTSREWIKKSIIMDELYVFNNPWAVQSMEKATSYAAMIRLGFPVPETWLVPPKEHTPSTDLQPTLDTYAKLFDLGEIGDKLGYPMFMKPYDGGAWVGVSKIDDEATLRKTYDESGKRVMHLQKAVDPFDLFVRIIGVGPQTNLVRYDPSAPLHDRYKVDFDFVTPEEASRLQRITMTINSFFGWDFNSCECLRREGTFHPIDFANPCPDSQVTSLHFHFPWIVMSQLKWSLFCAATDRKVRPCLNWEPYFEIGDQAIPFDDKLEAYGKLADEYFETDRFHEFCDKHLGNLDEVALEFFATPRAREAVNLKVKAMFPSHEVEEFTEHFWGLIQFWRRTQLDTGDSPKP